MINRIFVVTTISAALVRVYTIKKRFTMSQLRQIGTILSQPIVQRYFINTFDTPKSFSWAYEIGYLPGVTDNVATTVREMIEDALSVQFQGKEGVYTSQITFVYKPTIPLFNPLIQRCRMFSKTEFQKQKGFSNVVPNVCIKKKSGVAHIRLDIPNGELMTIGTQGIANLDGTRRGPLALDLPSMKAIQVHFQALGRNPTDVELESIAQTWSEHCMHTIMNSSIDDIPEGLFRRYIKGATNVIRKKKGKKDFCVSVFSDNSGAITFNRQWAITHKVETHNSPSALDPFGGAITGIVGVNRDCIGFGLGAKPIANTYGFCVGEMSDTSPLYRDIKLTQPMLSPRRILDGIVAGVNSGGNCSGIPTPLGFITVDRSYRGKPLVFVGTVGLVPKNRVFKRAQPGNLIVMMGGRVGLDGIHGATFSSESLCERSPATAVQIGDPITQKKLSDMLIKEVRDQNLYTSITDNGAGGLSCSVAEMAKECGGCAVDLEKVPLKYSGLAPWQIWISESQERMTLAVPLRKWKKLQALCIRRGVTATVIGKFTRSGNCIVRYKRKKVMDVSMDFLHNGKPKEHFVSKQPSLKQKGVWTPTTSVLSLLSHPSIAGYSWISTQFDHEVQGTSVVKPLHGKGRVNGDTVVIQPVLSSSRGIVLTQTLSMKMADGDPYIPASVAIESSIGKAVATGADPEQIALLDNFCWSSARDPERLWQLKRTAQACFDVATDYGTPFISGKDSMFNDFFGFDEKGQPVTISIPPTLLISAIGIIGDVRKSITIDFKFPGDIVYVLDGNKNLYQALSRAIRNELVTSAVFGGLEHIMLAVIKSALAGMLGVDISLRSGKIIASVHAKKQREFEHSMGSVPYKQIGVVTDTPNVCIRDINKRILFNETLNTCMKAYRSYEA